MVAPRPLNEAERLQVLSSYWIMDSEPERTYVDIARVAAVICGSPMSAVTLIDADRQWIKASYGVDATGTNNARDDTICAHCILGNEPMVVEDTQKDDRFRQNPFVVDAPHVRFYAGAPLLAPGGQALGTLCVFDDEPHALSAEQVQGLQSLARLVVEHFEQRKVTKALAQALERSKSLGELIPVCAYCRRIRDDQDYWASLEEYLKTHTDTDVSHGICPNCVQRHFPNQARMLDRE